MGTSKLQLPDEPKADQIEQCADVEQCTEDDQLGEFDFAQSNEPEKKTISVGYEFVCPGTAVHLGLRFKDQPSNALDGRGFPSGLWEKSSFFLPSSSHDFALTGVPDIIPQQCGPVPMTKAINRDEWREALQTGKKVSAEWFVLHDTGGGALPQEAPKGAERGVHLFIGKDAVFLNRDYAQPGSATRFEQKHREFRGRLIHVELINPSSVVARNPKDTFNDFQYRSAALAYIYASYRAGSWLTVTAHIEVDRGFNGGHSDPRGFNFERFYRTILILLCNGGEGKTFGILNERIGDNYNEKTYKNTFPAQYGAVLKEEKLKKTQKKK